MSMHRITAPALLLLAAALCVALPGDRGLAADAAKPATGAVKGAVKFSDGTVAANLKIEIYDLKAINGGKAQAATPLADKPGSKPPPPVASTTTDANGKYTLDKVPVGKYRLQAGDQMKGMAFLQVSVEANKTATHDLTIRKRRKPGL
jgi:hypothetical protein